MVLVFFFAVVVDVDVVVVVLQRNFQVDSRIFAWVSLLLERQCLQTSLIESVQCFAAVHTLSLTHTC